MKFLLGKNSEFQNSRLQVTDILYTILSSKFNGKEFNYGETWQACGLWVSSLLKLQQTTNYNQYNYNSLSFSAVARLTGDKAYVAATGHDETQQI